MNELKRDFKGVWIPSEIWNNSELTITGKILLACWDEVGYFTNKELAEFFQINESTIKRLKKDLKDKGYINSERKVMSYEELKKETLKKEGNRVCEWCKERTHILHEHHYPIPKRKGGTEVVKICPNCHLEFHKLEVMHNGKQ